MFDIISAFTLLLMEGFEGSQFIIPRPKQIIKRETPEMQGKTSSFPLTSCPEPAGQGETASCFGVAKVLKCLRRDLTFPGLGDKVELERMPLVVVEGVRELGNNNTGNT